MLKSETEEPRPTEPAPDPLLGVTLNGRFRIVSTIGVGGMGKVYKAVQLPLERAVALKVLDPAYARSADPNFLRRFLREAALTSQLRHPNTVTLIDYGQSGDIYYIAMEYLQGQTLSKLLLKQGPLTWPRALEIAQQICRSLREAHNLGVVHRDLKPANIMVMSEGDTDLVKVLDFGLVKSVGSEPETPQGMRPEGSDSAVQTNGAPAAAYNPEITQHGIFLGSPTYMAPEQAKNQSNLRSDIYSLGVVLYQMLVGRPPFLSKDHIELIFAHHREPPPPFNVARPQTYVPPEVEGLVMKCLKKNPDARYQSMDELLEAMRVAASSAGLSGVFPRSTTGTFRALSRQQMRAAAAGEPEVEAPTVLGQTVSARGRLLPLLGVLGAVLLLAGGGLLNQWLKSPSSPFARAPAPVAAPLPPPARFKVSSDPSGARVLWNGELMGLTPAAFEVPVGAGGSVTAELTLELEGYQPEKVTAGGSGEVVLSQKLRPLYDFPAWGPSAPVAEAPAQATAPVERPRPARVALAPVAATGAPTSTPAAAKAPEPAVPTAPQPAPEVAGAAEATEAGGASRKPLPFSDGMSQPVLLGGNPIEYSREALAARVEGDMLVRCVITTEGRLEDCEVVKGLPHMNDVVLKALSTRIYSPVTLQSKPVAVTYLFPFKLRYPEE